MTSAVRFANLQRLFAPRSVAVVGASASTGKVGHQALRSLRGFSGAVYPIHPNGGEILGRKVFPTLSAVGAPIDMVLFAIPATATVAVVEEAVRCGCGGGVILSGGFAETGADGAAAQERIRALCEQSGFRVLGPNTGGFFNTHIGLVASFAPGIDRIRAGRIGVIAQSGGINVITGFLVNRLGHGVSCGIGLGNSVDTDAADALTYLAEDADTHAIALHLEGVRHGRKLYEVLRRVTPRKPVAVLAVGREDVGEFAHSHTGNLIGSYALKAAALRQAGAVPVDATEDLAAAAAVLSLSRLPPNPAPGVGLIVGQAGAGLVMLDRLKGRGVSVPALQPQVVERIAKLLPPMTYLKNPVDTGRPGPAFAEVIGAVADDPAVDAIAVFAIDEPAAMQTQDVLVRAQQATGKPILFGTSGPESAIAPAIDVLRRQGLYVASAPERLADAAYVLACDAAAQWRLAQPARTVSLPADVSVAAHLDEHAAKQALEAIGIRVPRGVVCTSREAAFAARRALVKPVVAKILSGAVLHKTDVGGVHVGLADDATLERALDAIDAIPSGGTRRYLIEEMAPPGLEIIVGAVRDASFGPTVMVGAGGTAAEAMRDTAIRVAPVSLAEAHEMLNELRSAPLLDGWRGGAKLDRDALADAIARVGVFLDTHPGIREVEINPLRIYPHGVLALDALIVPVCGGD